eukprot:scaffold20356_cov125-Isochrysis_galbana.AAC.4
MVVPSPGRAACTRSDDESTCRPTRLSDVPHACPPDPRERPRAIQLPHVLHIGVGRQRVNLSTSD